MTHEEWRVIGEAPAYEVSNLGRVRRTATGRVLKPKRHAGGYVMTCLYSGVPKALYRTNHALVAEAFIGPRPRGQDINHKNFIRDDNRPENLEYVERIDNIAHSVRAGRNHKPPRIYPDTKPCRECGVEFAPNPKHRGRASTCSVQCRAAISARLIIEARKHRRSA